jgi:hypothetical protein
MLHPSPPFAIHHYFVNSMLIHHSSSDWHYVHFHLYSWAKKPIWGPFYNTSHPSSLLPIAAFPSHCPSSLKDKYEHRQPPSIRPSTLLICLSSGFWTRANIRKAGQQIGQSRRNEKDEENDGRGKWGSGWTLWGRGHFIPFRFAPHQNMGDVSSSFPLLRRLLLHHCFIIISSAGVFLFPHFPSASRADFFPRQQLTASSAAVVHSRLPPSSISPNLVVINMYDEKGGRDWGEEGSACKKNGL